ncbi:hypothetical protein ACHAWT_004698 [Skeletonema menzelii]
MSSTSFSSDFDANMKTKIASSVAKTERREEERSRVARETCRRCYRPPALCICQALPDKPVRTSTHVLILQHPRERRRKSLSTTPLVDLVLEKCTVKVGYNFTPDQLDLVQECFANGKKPLLLFPGEDSITLDQEGSQDYDNKEVDDITLTQLQQKNQLLVLIDGTWAEAKRMLLQSPELVENCIKVQFQSESESIYDSLRNEPEKHCLSTLECCARALSHLESSEECAERANEYLLGSMKCMVDKRIELTSKTPEPRFSRPGTKIYEKNKRRFEIKKELFDK